MDANGCIDSAFVTITQPDSLHIDTTSITNVSCNGLSDGAISTATTGGTATLHTLGVMVQQLRTSLLYQQVHILLL